MSLFVGLDLHKKYSEYAVMDVGGKLLRQGKFENTMGKMREFSESVPARSSMVIESSSTWYWAHRLLSERHNVTLSNPVKNKAIASAKVKTDIPNEPNNSTRLVAGHLSSHSFPKRLAYIHSGIIPSFHNAPLPEQPYSKFGDCPLSVFQGASSW